MYRPSAVYSMPERWVWVRLPSGSQAVSVNPASRDFPSGPSAYVPRHSVTATCPRSSRVSAREAMRSPARSYSISVVSRKEALPKSSVIFSFSIRWARPSLYQTRRPSGYVVNWKPPAAARARELSARLRSTSAENSAAVRNFSREIRAGSGAGAAEAGERRPWRAAKRALWREIISSWRWRRRRRFWGLKYPASSGPVENSSCRFPPGPKRKPRSWAQRGRAGPRVEVAK